MPIRVGNSKAVAAIKIGTTNVSRVYLGSTLIEDFGGAPPALWTPAALGSALVLWLDAQDTGTVTLNGTTVAQWDDKSANGNHLDMGVANRQPDWSTTGLNGFPTLVIPTETEVSRDDGNPTLGNTDLDTKEAGEAWSVFVVGDGGDGTAKFQSTSGRAGLMIGKSAGLGSGGTFALGLATHDNTDTPLTPPRWFVMTNGYAGGNGLQNVPTYTDGALNTPAVVGAVWDGSAIAATLDGAPFAFTGPGRGVTNQNAPLKVGACGLNRNSSAGGGGNSKTGEVVICDTALSVADRQRLEGYLAWRWGLAANLPVQHPYRSAPPTV